MTASTLNLRDPDFVNFINGNGPLQFTAENYQAPGYTPPTLANYNAALAANAKLPSPSSQVAVSNHGIIATQSGGSIYLIAPVVENNGSITAPNGAISLISALPQTNKSSLITYDLDVSSQREVLYAQGVDGGSTVNYQNGLLSADSGLVRLCGATVENDGTIQALSTAAQNGTIELQASGLITTGVGASLLAHLRFFRNDHP